MQPHKFFLVLIAWQLLLCSLYPFHFPCSCSEIYPTLIVIGLENIVIIVKAVMSTLEELDVKYCIAVVLSKEGWAITRNIPQASLCVGRLELVRSSRFGHERYM